MANQITNYKCPACTAPLHYGHESGRLECDYCGSSYSVEEVEALYAQQNQNAAENHAKEEAKPVVPEEELELPGSDWGSDAKKLRAYNCPSCGAELICEETTAATACPYCNNPTIIPGNLAGTKKPDLVIPFKLDKKAAMAALKKHYQGKKLLPNAFSEENHIQEIKGIYVPFWLYDTEADADMEFTATRSHVHNTRKEIITETDHFAVRRRGTVNFEKVPVDGSSKMPDAHMDAIEPYDYSELKPFSISYLPGFFADKYDVSKEDSAQRAKDRCANSAEMAMQETVIGYETCVSVRKDIEVRPKTVKYALLPVWLLSTQWNGKNFLFAMNGQTGKFIGDLPIDTKKLLFWCAGAFTAATAAFGWLFW